MDEYEVLDLLKHLVLSNNERTDSTNKKKVEIMSKEDELISETTARTLKFLL